MSPALGLAQLLANILERQLKTVLLCGPLPSRILTYPGLPNAGLFTVESTIRQKANLHVCGGGVYVCAFVHAHMHVGNCAFQISKYIFYKNVKCHSLVFRQ